MSTADRVFQDRMTLNFVEKIQASAAKRYGARAVWFERDCRGPTGKTYKLQKLGVEGAIGECVAIADPNRKGAVHWSEHIANEGWRRVEQ